MALTLCLIIGMVSPVGFSNEEKNFTDVAEEDWFYEAVQKLAHEGIISGFDDGSFKPMENVTRDAFATMMVKTLDLDLEKPDSAWFKDVEKDHWAYKYVETSKYYMTGYSSGSSYYFMPDDKAVREDMAVALVKALKYDIDGNLDYLDTFTDADKISDKLKDYVATAVKHDLMSGSPSGDAFVFNPQSDLTRAETAALLMKLMKVEKVVVDDIEKVTFDNMKEPDKADEQNNEEPISNDEKTSQIESIVKDDRIVLEWSKVNPSGFKGYKVVASASNASPTYPNDGYFKYITDINTNRIEIEPYAGYSGGDIDVFKPNEKYYFSITTLYEDGNYYGRTENGVMPGQVVEIKDYQTPKVEAFVDDGRILVKWDKIDHPYLDGYKVVASQGDTTPAYPENGYLKWITDTNVTSYEIKPDTSYSGGDFKKFKSGENFYISITAVYKDRKIPGNSIKVVMP